MKARMLFSWLLGAMLAGAVVAPGFAQDSVHPFSATVPPDKSGTGTPSPPPAGAPGGAGVQSLPFNIQLSPWSSEIQMLAQAAVDESVMLAYITNSPHSFNLNPDQIIHLRNASVPRRVISAMIQHDQALRTTAPAPTDPAVPTGALAAPPGAPGDVQIVANDEPWEGDYLSVDDGYSIAEQPQSAGPVRAPYPVKLNDPIVILKLPTFTVPYW